MLPAGKGPPYPSAPGVSSRRKAERTQWPGSRFCYTLIACTSWDFFLRSRDASGSPCVLKVSRSGKQSLGLRQQARRGACSRSFCQSRSSYQSVLHRTCLPCSVLSMHIAKRHQAAERHDGLRRFGCHDRNIAFGITTSAPRSRHTFTKSPHPHVSVKR